MAVGVLSDDGEQPLRAEIVLYQADGANVPVLVRSMNDTMWLTQREMGELFGTTASNVSMHLKNIFAEGELAESDSVIKFRISEFNKKPSNLYNLDAIIAVGYRVNSLKATRFRQWATATLKEYIVKGYVLNDDMLKNGAPFGKDYFDELIVRIRDIRASERRVYQKITDIFQECSFDYDKNSETARRFYATVQNKLHYAITGHTAAEIIAERSDAGKPSMGLTSWKGAPEGPIHSSDVTVPQKLSDVRRGGNFEPSRHHVLGRRGAAREGSGSDEHGGLRTGARSVSTLQSARSASWQRGEDEAASRRKGAARIRRISQDSRSHVRERLREGDQEDPRVEGLREKGRRCSFRAVFPSRPSRPLHM